VKRALEDIVNNDLNSLFVICGTGVIVYKAVMHGDALELVASISIIALYFHNLIRVLTVIQEEDDEEAVQKVEEQ
jgi:hypothetical protein